MGIQDIASHFEAEIEGSPLKLIRVTMDYDRDIRSVQVFKFRVSKDGATNEIEIECRDYADIPVIAKLAADRAKTWAETA